ncbi:MAG TPA: malto-oligosyltrehalose trehalohydrolase [Nitrospiraceae bacterium]|nr:malto-oligosyltrehalose trehalohydrolase [Nitrospiraceae bacterium]
MNSESSHSALSTHHSALPQPWRLDLGADVQPGGVHFRVWAPRRKRVEVLLEEVGQAIPLEKNEDGYFTGLIPNAKAGMRYRYRLDGEAICPDPCSRFQPEGPHGPSMIVDPSSYAWQDTAWPGVRLHGQVIYEMHVGTFTREGTLDAAVREVDELRRVGITVIELMPMAECPGRWNWGYDGVGLYAPSHTYGDHDALKRFVDAAHAADLGVLLDVVYNHVGPDGNYFKEYSDTFFTDRYKNEWGKAINFDGPGSRPVREFVVQNACYWIAEFHLDGLRLDATQQIFDASPVHILAELSQQARRVAGARSIVLLSENEPQDIRTIAPLSEGGYGLDGMWNDDFHHAARVALTGRREAYYTDYRGHAQEFISAAKRGFLYQGQRYAWQKKPRGGPVTNEPAAAFITYIQNHDQVANNVHGARIHAMTDPARYRALAAMMLLAPETPMLFMGQEFGASTPFLFFADHTRDLAKEVHQGRKKFLSQFPSYGSPEAEDHIDDPSLDSTFERSKIDFTERQRHADMYRFHQDLLRLRRDDPVIASQDRHRLDGAVLSDDSFALRYTDDRHGDRLVIVNLGPDLDFRPAPEPLLAPPGGCTWMLAWSSDHPEYGGPGIVNPLTEQGWKIPGASATLLRAASS